MFPRSRNIRDGWTDHLSELEREFDRERTLKLRALIRESLKERNKKIRLFVFEAIKKQAPK